MTAVCTSCASLITDMTPSCPVCGAPTGAEPGPSPQPQPSGADTHIARLRAVLADRYEIGDVVGRGGMAVVLRAYDRKHGRSVAVKVLRPEVAAAVGAERFQREVEIAARFTHPHVLPLYDSGDADGVLYYVMPFVEGQTLRDRLRREGSLRAADAVRIAREIADALAYAHEHGVVHRDIKPENILLESGHAVVTDFGVARAVASATSPRTSSPGVSAGTIPDGAVDDLTATGLALGTPAYMSPQQAQGDSVDGRTDVYALGCVLHEMLTGRPPFVGDSIRAVIAAHALEPPPAPRVPGAPNTLGRIVQRALAKDPGERFPTAAGFSHALGTIRFVNPRLRALAAAAAVTLAIGAVATYGFWPRLQLDEARVVVFPFSVAGADDPDSTIGEDVARALYWMLSMSAALRGQDGWPLLEPDLRDDPRRLTDRRARDLVERDGAGRYLRGEILLADSLRVHLSLGNVRWGTEQESDLVLPLGVGAWVAGRRAAPTVLSWLLAGGEPLDTAGLVAHPRAIPPFLAGERAYRRADFAAASAHYAEAIGFDSTFVLAYVRAAQAASWQHHRPEAASLLDHAIPRDSLVPARYRPFLRALRILARASYGADSAVAYLEQALAADPRWPEAWMALGEVHAHMIAGTAAPDSASQAAFTQVRRLDATFTPVLYHEVPAALWRGDVAAAQRDRDAFVAAGRALGAVGMADTLQATLDLMVRCVTGDLDAGVTQPHGSLLEPLKETVRWMATAGLRQPKCAAHAARTLMAIDRGGDYAFGAMMATQSVLVVAGQVDSLRALLDREQFGPGLAGDFYLLDALALLQAGNVGGFAALTPRAEARANELRATLAAGRLDSLPMWLLGSWEAATGNVAAAGQLADRLAALHDSLRAVYGDASPPDDAVEADVRTVGLFATSLRARTALAAGDSAGALADLATLRPTENRTAIEWYPWSALGWEQVTLAQLLLAAGRNEEALRAASVMDSPASVPLIMYLPASLQVREAAARRLGRREQSQAFADRLAALRSAGTLTP